MTSKNLHITDISCAKHNLTEEKVLSSGTDVDQMWALFSYQQMPEPC